MVQIITQTGRVDVQDGFETHVVVKAGIGHNYRTFRVLHVLSVWKDDTGMTRTDLVVERV